MFGVLVVECKGEIGYLAAFSGKLQDQWQTPGFVPPPFNQADVHALLEKATLEINRLSDAIRQLEHSTERSRLTHRLAMLEQQFEQSITAMQADHKARRVQRAEQRALLHQNKTDSSGNNKDGISRQLSTLDHESSHDKQQRKILRRDYDEQRTGLESALAEFDSRVSKLKTQRKNLSAKKQAEYFSQFELPDSLGQPIELEHLFPDRLPAAGTGECAAPKLLAYAKQSGYRAIAGTEFWWGPSPPGQVMHHATFYPPCQSKCSKLLTLMDGPEAPGVGTKSQNTNANVLEDAGIRVLYKDDVLAVLDKPAGLLSVPGKLIEHSVLSIVREAWPGASGPLLVHRLDMDTSGILLVALTGEAHRHLHKQFEARVVGKRYRALVAGSFSENHETKSGVIDLPLRPDIDNRPRQMVCEAQGKPSITEWHCLGERITSRGVISELELRPLTGRTHQIRLHLASSQGLGMPILGDPLYEPHQGLGAAPDRMMLHAYGLDFLPPETQQRVSFESPPPF